MVLFISYRKFHAIGIAGSFKHHILLLPMTYRCEYGHSIKLLKGFELDGPSRVHTLRRGLCGLISLSGPNDYAVPGSSSAIMLRIATPAKARRRFPMGKNQSFLYPLDGLNAF